MSKCLTPEAGSQIFQVSSKHFSHVGQKPEILWSQTAKRIRALKVISRLNSKKTQKTGLMDIKSSAKLIIINVKKKKKERIRVFVSRLQQIRKN